MADADDKLDFCKQALGEIGTRSTITAVDPPDGSPEAFYCNLFFNGTRDQVLRAAHWNFAANTRRPPLWKASPGTPENPTIPAGYVWSNRDPAPGWLYSYIYKETGIIQIRRVREGASYAGDLSFFYGGVSTNKGDCAPFEVMTDWYDRAGASINYTKTVTITTLPTILTPGTGYRASDYITMVGDAASLMGQPVVVEVGQIGAGGSVVTAFIVSSGTFSGPLSSLTQQSTTGTGTGFTFTPILVTPPQAFQKVILSNARDIIIDYTTNAVAIAQYDPMFADAFMLALEGKLALALLGDRALYGAKLQEANNSILNARVRDGNEGLTTYDHVPDWLQVRGVASMGSPSNWYNPPYGPLFAV